MEDFIDPAASEGGRQGGGGFLSVYAAFWRKTEVIKLYLTNHCLAVCTTEVHRELDVSPRAISTRVELATCSLSIKTDKVSLQGGRLWGVRTRARTQTLQQQPLWLKEQLFVIWRYQELIIQERLASNKQ